MKKVLNVCLFLMLCLFSFKLSVDAYTGSKINDNYFVMKDKDGNIVYSNNFLYFSSGSSFMYSFYDKNAPFGVTYNSYNQNAYEHFDEETKNYIGKIIHYGYEYEGHMDIKWYVVSQMLIYKTKFKDYDIYFSDGINGNRINKYEEEMNELESLLEEYVAPSNISVNYNDRLDFNDIKYDDYEIISSNMQRDTEKDYFTAINIKGDGIFNYRKKVTNRYTNNLMYLDEIGNEGYGFVTSGNYFPLIRTIKVNVRRSNVTVNYNIDDSIYTSNSDLSNICFDIFMEMNKVNRICNLGQSVTMNNLYQGNYYIQQVGSNYGYELNEEKVLYKIDNDNGVIDIKLKPISKIVKFAGTICVDDVCTPMNNVKFNVYDNDGNYVMTKYTDGEGNIDIEIGYGSYVLKQESNLEGFDMSPDIEFVVDENSEDLFFGIKNHYIETEDDNDDKKEDNSDINDGKLTLVKPSLSTSTNNLEDNSDDNEEEQNEDNVGDNVVNSTLSSPAVSIPTNVLDKVENNINSSNNSDNSTIDDEKKDGVVGTLEINDGIGNTIVKDDCITDNDKANELLFEDVIEDDDDSGYYYSQLIENPYTGAFISYLKFLYFILFFNVFCLIIIKLKAKYCK